MKSGNKNINKNLDKLIRSILKMAEKYMYYYSGFTHLKNAQAISFSHYLMAYIEMFLRIKKDF